MGDVTVYGSGFRGISVIQPEPVVTEDGKRVSAVVCGALLRMSDTDVAGPGIPRRPEPGVATSTSTETGCGEPPKALRMRLRNGARDSGCGNCLAVCFTATDFRPIMPIGTSGVCVTATKVAALSGSSNAVRRARHADTSATGRQAAATPRADVTGRLGLRIGTTGTLVARVNDRTERATPAQAWYADTISLVFDGGYGGRCTDQPVA